MGLSGTGPGEGAGQRALAKCEAHEGRVCWEPGPEWSAWRDWAVRRVGLQMPGPVRLDLSLESLGNNGRTLRRTVTS